MGSARHFRTMHGILGLLTTIIALTTVLLHYIVMVRKSYSAFDGLFRQRQLVSITSARFATNQILLCLSIVTVLTGFVDLASISLCLTHVVSMEIGILIGFNLAGISAISQAVSGLDGYLTWREKRATKI